ncbi:hypothetical protein TNCV_2102161, partial [Trichonephila clavipes]
MDKNDSPCHHSKELAKSSGFSRLDAKSTGFCFEGT